MGSEVDNSLVCILRKGGQPIGRVATFDVEDGDRQLEAHVAYDIPESGREAVYTLVCHRMMEATVKLYLQLRKEFPGIQMDGNLMREVGEVFSGS